MRTTVSRDLGISQKEYNGLLFLIKEKGIKLEYVLDYETGSMRFKPLESGSIEKLEAGDKEACYKILNNLSQKFLRRYQFYKKFQEVLSTLSKIQSELPLKVSIAFNNKIKNELQTGKWTWKNYLLVKYGFSLD